MKIYHFTSCGRNLSVRTSSLNKAFQIAKCSLFPAYVKYLGSD